MTITARRRTVPGASRADCEWETTQAAGIEVLQATALKKLPWLSHGFSTRRGGESQLDGRSVLNLGITEWDSRARVEANRQLFAFALGVEESTLVRLRQYHSDVIHLILDRPKQAPRGDAALTDASGVLLAVQTADCVPILLVDVEHRAAAAVHAGWRGTLKRIAAKTLGRMRMTFDTRPQDVIAVLGPAIRQCCYEVGPEVACAFASQFANAVNWFDPFETEEKPNPLQWLSRVPPGHPASPKKSRLDLVAANTWQLADAGVPSSRVIASPLCTACRTDLLFSYRREGARTGRLMAAIGIRGQR